VLLRNPFKSRIVKAYWWKEVPNFGDALAPLLLERFADIKVAWDTISHAQVASIGSILEHIPPMWDGYILGSGMLHENSRLHLHGMTSGITAKILALRGPLTARVISGDYALGDPGILADELIEMPKKEWDLGILPHFTDTELVPRFEKLMPAGTVIKVINPGDAPLEVVRQIGACRRIVTSSLHGMIIADAFGLPRRVEMAKANLKDGGDFKFRDYSASIQTKWEIGKMMEASRFRVEDIKFQIYDAFRALSKELK
jgi:pyruvyltransferase